MTDLPTLDVKSNIPVDTTQANHKRTSQLTAGILVALLIAFFIFTLYNVINIIGQVNNVRSGAYPVSVAAGRVETLLVQMRTITNRPAYILNDEVLETVQRSYDTVDIDLANKINYIADNVVYYSADGDLLREDYGKLKDVREEYLELLSTEGTTTQDARYFIDTRMDPLIDSMIDLDIQITNESNDIVEEVYASVNSSGVLNIIITLIFMVAVIMSLVIYLSLLRRNEQQEQALREKLEHALDLAQSANAAKSLFLSNMSHDIRTPMNAIIGLTTIAKTHINDRLRVEECLTKITASSNHLLGLINDVLDMGKIESGKLVLNLGRFSLPNLISEFMTMITPQVRSKHLNFDVLIGNIEQEMVIGDTMRIDQVLLNLASNAIKYTPEGGTIRIHLSEEESERPGYLNYKFIFSDTGIGMDEQFLEKVFDPFERERNETTNFTEGTGLGLAITKNIVDLMQGTIGVQSKLGEGTTFTVVIPLMPSPDDQEEFDTTSLAGMHVLVVDDDHDVLENTRIILSDFGMRPDTAETGFEALALTTGAHEQSDDYQAIIVDWKMPEMDGLETIRRIRDMVGDDTPILLLTAYDWTEIEDEAKKAGVSAFITKPLFKSRLFHVLSILCLDQPDQNTVTPGSDALNKPITGRVLLVEDNELNSEIAHELIQNLGADVEIAENGYRAVELVDEKPESYYQLIFMDWQMPKMDGIQATKTIIEHCNQQGKKHPPIVAMTANAFNEHRDKALECGMDGFMAKPINIKELENNLRKYLT